MVALTYPGVYVQEVSSGVRTITGVSTSTAMFIGRTERGVMNKPTRVFNYSDFSRRFGASTTNSELATSARLFFANGGTQAYIMRIASGADSASVTLKDATGTNKHRWLEPGRRPWRGLCSPRRRCRSARGAASCSS